MASRRPLTTNKPKTTLNKNPANTLIISPQFPIHFFELPRLVSELYNLWAASPQPVIKKILSKSVGRGSYPFSYEYQPPSEQKSENEVKDFVAKPASTLASLLLISRFLRQAKLESRLCFLNTKTNAFENWNHEFALEWWKNEKEYAEVKVNLTQTGIENLLDDDCHVPLEWMGIKSLMINGHLFRRNNPKLSALSQHMEFKASEYMTIFKILVTPLKSLKELVNNVIHDDPLKKSLYKKLMTYQSELLKEALLVKDFRAFLFTRPERNPEFGHFLKRFPSTDHSNILEKANSLTASEKLEEFILESKYDIEFQKKSIKELMTDKINEEKNIDKIIELIEKLTTDESYQVIKDRHKLSGFSLWGFNHQGQPVSTTFSEIIAIAKKRIVEIAKESNITDLDNYWDLLSSHRTTSWLGYEPLLNFFKVPTTSMVELAKEKDLKDEFVVVVAKV